MSLLTGEVSNIDPSLKNHFSDPSIYWQFLEKRGLSERKFNLYDIDEAHDYLFYRLILTYFDNLNFQETAKSAFGKISKRQISVDKKFMDKARKDWLKLLSTRSGPYLQHIFDEYNRKKKLLETLLNTDQINGIELKFRMHQLDLISFHLYYFVRLWFGGKPTAYHEFVICGLRFVFDPYSYIHIMSRHYMESINDFDIEKSFNEELIFIDIRDLPISFERIIRHYSFYKTIYLTDEYLIIESKGNPYIIWFKYRSFHGLGYVMHVRTFYKIKEARDFEKMKNLKKIRNDDHLFFYI